MGAAGCDRDPGAAAHEPGASGGTNAAADPADATKTVAAPYNAAASAGSNLGPTNAALIDRVSILHLGRLPLGDACRAVDDELGAVAPLDD